MSRASDGFMDNASGKGREEEKGQSKMGRRERGGDANKVDFFQILLRIPEKPAWSNMHDSQTDPNQYSNIVHHRESFFHFFFLSFFLSLRSTPQELSDS